MWTTEPEQARTEGNECTKGCTSRVVKQDRQYHGDCADWETEARVHLDLRWKHALGLDVQDAGFSPRSDLVSAH